MLGSVATKQNQPKTKAVGHATRLCGVMERITDLCQLEKPAGRSEGIRLIARSSDADIW